ncbi:hypothetical protein M3G03_11155 [Aestuariimicrobium sp. p3-SID1156]|uniref:hypothetical protein n=1 Tax=Aestuariimicrobium sp. p3-SID1156 TaxID=2916038 RepID=UPI00223AA5A2|nr:hypothetical protein [Aestuariimicrobium sp. p3-SID1156]MCT1460085.1 hypothetical protein [Aestuariimicrobium sp. p3-SID1156]
MSNWRAWGAGIVCVALAGCGGGESAAPVTVTVTASESTSSSPETTTAPAPSPTGPVRVSTVEELIAEVEKVGVTCKGGWESGFDEYRSSCDDPEVRLFLDPRPDLEPDVKTSTCTLWTTMGLTAFRGPNWVAAGDWFAGVAIEDLGGEPCK